MMQVEFDDSSSSRDGDDELAILQIKPPQTSSETISVLNNKNEKKKRHSKESNRRHHHHHHHHHHHKYDTLKTSNADSSYRTPDMENKLLHYRDNKSKDLNSEHEKNITGEDMDMNDRRSKKPTKDIDSDKEKNIKYEITNVRQIKLVKNIKESRKYSYGTEERSTHFLEKMKLEWRNKRLQYLEHQRNKDPSPCTEKEDLQDNYCEKETSKHSENIHIENSGNENSSIENLKIENERYCTLVSLVSSEDESMDYNEETANDELSDSKTENVCNLEDNVEISDHNSSDDNSTGNKTAEENLENGSINESEKVELFKKNSFVETTKETIVSNKKENLKRNPKEENEMPSVSGEKCPLQATTKHTSKLPVYCPAIQGCRNIDGFHVLNRIEEGTYGVVYRARDKETKEIVALKRLKMEREKEGFPITSLREINTLLKAQHPNIVTVREIVVGSNMDRIYIVMDYVEHDLKSLMKTMPRPFLIGEVKTLLMQLLCAVAHLHDNWILHRDLKTSNLLLSHQGILKVGDFGLAREYGSPLKSYTPVVVTLWYRAPELLLGAKKYSTPIDMWSVGCIFGELLTKNALFPGKSESDQINRIFKDLGTPSENIWPGYNELPLVQSLNITQYPYNNLKSRFSHTFTDIGFDLLNKFLTYNPARRISAEKAKSHEFFNEKPRPVPPNMFPTWPARSEQEYRTARSSPKPPLGGINYSRH